MVDGTAVVDRAVDKVYGSTKHRPKGYPLDKIWTVHRQLVDHGGV
jgi:hypothetical protein